MLKFLLRSCFMRKKDLRIIAYYCSFAAVILMFLVYFYIGKGEGLGSSCQPFLSGSSAEFRSGETCSFVRFIPPFLSITFVVCIYNYNCCHNSTGFKYILMHTKFFLCTGWWMSGHMHLLWLEHW